MNKKESIKIINKYIPYFKKILNLEDWYFEFKYNNLNLNEEDFYYAELNNLEYEYKSATISFNYNVHKTKEDLLDSLVHELIHIIVAPFSLYKNMVDSILPEGDTKQVLHNLYESMDELTNKQLRIILFGKLNHNIKSLIKEADKLNITDITPY